MHLATAHDMLDKAVATALALAVPCSGWILQREARGFAAWLYHETDDGDEPLFDEVAVIDSAEGAAAWVLRQAGRLRDPVRDPGAA